MRVLISPNAFKNSLTAGAAAAAIEEGLQQSALQCETKLFPIGDGGDGTGALMTSLLNGRTITAPTVDALNRHIQAEYGLINNGRTAVIEMAAASGLHLLHRSELDPLLASSFGTGIQIKQAIDEGAREILLCVGGSATVDGGSGLLQALGFRFYDGSDKLLIKLPMDLSHLSVVDTSLIDERLKQCIITILCDVKNPLLGAQGAAAIFGPQKGASPEQVKQLESGLRQFAEIIFRQTGKDISGITYGGAAGGIAAVLSAILNARLVSGSDYFLHLTAFDKALQAADLVITGEGSLDKQTLEGKAPFAVAEHCRKRAVPAIAMAGKINDEQSLQEYFSRVLCINETMGSLEEMLAATRINLIRAARTLGNELAQKGRSTH